MLFQSAGCLNIDLFQLILVFFFIPPPTTVSEEHHVFRLSVWPSVRCPLTPILHDVLSLYLVERFE